MARPSVSVRTLPPDEVLARLRRGDNDTLEALYREYREPFLLWLGKQHPYLSTDEIADAYQDSVLALYEVALSGKLQHLRVEISTYLFTIGNHHCQKVEKKSANRVKVLTPFDSNRKEPADMSAGTDLDLGFIALADDPLDTVSFEEAFADRLATVDRGLYQLSEECYRLLRTAFYTSLTAAELAAEFNYRDANVAMSRKSACLARLRVLCGISKD